MFSSNNNSAPVPKVKDLGTLRAFELPSGHVVTIKAHHIDVLESLFDTRLVQAIPAIPAIKFVRAEYGLGLKEAKDIVDFLRNCYDICRHHEASNVGAFSERFAVKA